MEENYSKTDKNNEKQEFLSESEELSKNDPPADFDISIEELTAKLAEKKKVELKKREEEKIVLEVREEFEKTSEESKPFQIQIEEEEKPKSFSIKIEEEKPEEHHHESFIEEFEKPSENSQTPHKSTLNIDVNKSYSKSSVREPPKTHKQTFTSKKNFLQRNKWILVFAILLVTSYFWFHPTENELVSTAAVVNPPLEESVKEIPQTTPVEKIDLREERLRKLIMEGVNS